jgi:hypothetical protein
MSLEYLGNIGEFVAAVAVVKQLGVVRRRDSPRTWS